MDQKVTSAFMGAMLLDAMRHNQVSVQELAKKVGYTPSLISKATHDQARIQFDAVADLLAALPEQNQFFAIDVANKALGITTPVIDGCLLYTSPSPRDVEETRMPSSA
ncbi:prophage P1 protein 14 [Lactobacillus plantarum WCFS1] [Lactiplantibacillus mudanjiangensis]|nr:prophage P1 protein 14 [Lactobacillus plantarum WCFS1] [Lactiplantibacillus mudanjiangensis]